tara:strand:+ start:2488 stop:2943 length:456 start_codon:yes stop_codon:yes gene_type:complete
MVDWSKISKDVPKFTFEGETKTGKVVEVYDGDSVKVVFPLYSNTVAGMNVRDGPLYKWTCRINGVDTPELRTKNILEKNMGKNVRDKLREKILNKVVTLKCGDFDKYGRILVDIECDKCDISKWLIENEYAFEYHGGTKKDWGEYLDNQQE